MNDLELQLDTQDQVLRVHYNPLTSHSIYDICDANGSVIKTGPIQENGVNIDIKDLEEKEYLLLILDGDSVVKRRIQLDEREEE